MDRTHSLDPTRLVDGPLGWTDFGGGDLLDLHYYPGPGIPPLQDDRAGVLGEFGGLKLVLEGHLWQEGENWGYQETESREDLNKTYLKLLDDVATLVPKGLAAAIYTQTSDVEIEVNGLMTYDRKVLKLDRERAAAAAEKLYQKPARLEFVLPCSEQKAGIRWKYTLEEPQGEWFETGFDDSAWKDGVSGFGWRWTSRIFGTDTPWDTTGIWLRKEFELTDIPGGKLFLNVISHATVSAIYVNGEKVAMFSPTKEFHQLVDFDIILRKLLRPGKNILAVYGLARDPPMETWGVNEKRQFVDVGILTLLNE
jgi:hypothetical protein